ncbi:hypothetical protein [Clostridium paraputrificum]|uniref:hypothetical protein n=1 Tax=Clostridium paraputrificum TaxID=29363 RepID=UPI000C071E1F|nr:hypothetical protein [Clostridium paraputrificum]MDB2108306.1 hypothetical protein [Clostridium paraputrificum]MDB2115194.1 hypothetical protein [Clostridium paraputrificum]
MNRYIMGNQIMGYTFIKLLEKDQHEIELNRICEIQSKVEISIRRENNAILDFTENDLYGMQQSYSDIFELNDKYMKINDYTISRMEEDRNQKLRLMNKLSRYFTLGMPIDIGNTVERTIKTVLREYYGE